MARIAFLMDSEYEDSEFQGPFESMRAAGHECRVIGLTEGMRLTGKRGQSHAEVDEAVETADPNAYDALVIPGGHSPDRLRAHAAPTHFVRGFVARDVPIAAICHGPQLLIEAGAVRGRTLTSWISIRTDLENAGANWVDLPVAEDGNLITSRNPADVPAFVAALGRRLSNGAGPKASGAQR